MGYSDISHFLSTSIGNNKVIFVLISILIIVFIIDTSVIKIYYFSYNQSPVSWRVALFIGISSVYLVGIYLVSQFVKQRSEHIRKRQVLHINTLHKIVVISQYLLTAVTIFVVFQIVIMSRYNAVLLTVATWISYITAIIMMAVLAQQFFSWFKSNKNSTVFLYGLASAMLAINAGFILIFVSLVLRNVPAYAQPHVGVGSPFFTLGPWTDILYYGYVISSIVSFMLWWIATVSALRHYSEKSQKRYWFILSIPLVYFLIQFQPLFLSLFSSFLASEPVLFSTIYTLVFTVSKPVGGILFSIAFWTMARKLGNNNVVRNYMIISAYGLVLVFVSNQAVVLVSAPYPPFGLATASFMGISSYLLLVGIYSSAISLGEDSKLRQTIRKLAIKESKLLDSIGTAQMEQEIQSRVIAITRKSQKNLVNETGVESSLSEDEVKHYLHEVLTEIKKKTPTNGIK